MKVNIQERENNAIYQRVFNITNANGVNAVTSKGGNIMDDIEIKINEIKALAREYYRYKCRDTRAKESDFKESERLTEELYQLIGDL